MSRRVLISGASSTGPALIYWLARYGHDLSAVLRAPALRPPGRAADFREVHLSVLEKTGIWPRSGPDPLHMIDAEGRDQVTLPASFTQGPLAALNPAATSSSTASRAAAWRSTPADGTPVNVMAVSATDQVNINPTTEKSRNAPTPYIYYGSISMMKTKSSSASSAN